MKVKTGELSGAALDWAVGIAAKNEDVELGIMAMGRNDFSVYILSGKTLNSFNPSIDWSQCGPLIDKYSPLFNFCKGQVRAEILGAIGAGDTYLIAICRAIVASVLGDEIDIPDQLVGGR